MDLNKLYCRVVSDDCKAVVSVNCEDPEISDHP